jgi:hypothetical protein
MPPATAAIISFRLSGLFFLLLRLAATAETATETTEAVRAATDKCPPGVGQFLSLNGRPYQKEAKIAIKTRRRSGRFVIKARWRAISLTQSKARYNSRLGQDEDQAGLTA